MAQIYEKLSVTPIGMGPTLSQGNGFGTSLSGFFAEPLVTGGYYKQFTFTLAFIPVYFGEIYLLGNRKGQGARYFGRISADDFRRRFGVLGYLKLRASGMFESVLVGALAFCVLFLVSYLVLLLFGRI